MAKDYTYQVARIRALETGLFTNSTIEQLLVCSDMDQAIHFLEEKGWGDSDTAGDPDKILSREEEKIWEVVKDLDVDISIFDVLSYPKEFHNLKAAIKEEVTSNSVANIMYDDCNIPKDEMRRLINEKDFDSLPVSMAKAAKEAYDTLSHTGDGQLADIVIDKACLEAIRDAGKKAERSGNKVIKNYAETFVAVADIRTAVRAATTGKSKDILLRALAECDGLNIDELAKAAISGGSQIKEYLETTDYRDAVDPIGEGPSVFERWCDDHITESLMAEKYETFTIGPVIAYVIARQNEIKTVRIILSGKANGLSDEEIRERVREMYV